jgi:hypothetical protein
VATDKDKGLLGGATDGLRETTTGALGGGGPWHSPNSDVYHNNPAARPATASPPRTSSRGTGDKSLCGECERLNGAGGPVGNLTGL